MGKKSRRKRVCQGGANYFKLLSMLPPCDLPYAPDGPEGVAAPKRTRQMADFVYRNFLYFQRDKLNPMRFLLFRAYVNFIHSSDNNPNEVIWNEKDVQALRKVANNRKRDEPPHFQVESLFLLSTTQHSREYDMESCADSLETIIDTCKNATQRERSQKLVVWLQNAFDSVDELLRVRQQQAQSLLEELYHQTKMKVFTPDFKLVEEPQSAGNHCDYCQKTKQELGVKKLLCCSRCQFEYYCDKECQTMAWKAKHKKYCRIPGDFRPGDQCLDVRNGKRIVLISPTTKSVATAKRGESWLVSDIVKENERMVSTKALRRLRPALWEIVLTREEKKAKQKEIQEKMKEKKQRMKELQEKREQRIKEWQEKREELQKEIDELDKKIET